VGEQKNTHKKGKRKYGAVRGGNQGLKYSVNCVEGVHYKSGHEREGGLERPVRVGAKAFPSKKKDMGQISIPEGRGDIRNKESTQQRMSFRGLKAAKHKKNVGWGGRGIK